MFELSFLLEWIFCSDALILFQELIRVSVLWSEQWHVALEEASRLYFSEANNYEGMYDVLAPLHATLEVRLFLSYVHVCVVCWCLYACVCSPRQTITRACMMCLLRCACHT